MSGALMVVAGVVGALILCETVLPRALAALRKRRREQAKAKAGEKKNADGFAVRKVGEMACGYDGPSGLRHNAISPRLSPSTDDATVAFPDWTAGARSAETAEGRVGATEKIDNSKVASSLATSENAKIACRAHPTADRPLCEVKSPERCDLRSNDADRLWEEARGMTHNFTPDWEEDRDYLSKIYTAARLGHLEAMVKLGDYAYRRGAVVEAFYWTFLAELKGAMGLDEALCEMRTQWLAEGCPAEFENAYAEFAEEQGDFARAVLCLQCEIDPQYACARLRELAERGCEEARLFLGKGMK